MKVGHLVDQINVGKYGSHLRQELNNYGSILIDHLYSFIYSEVKGQELLDVVNANLGEYIVVEHFGLFYRFNVQKN